MVPEAAVTVRDSNLLQGRVLTFSRSSFVPTKTVNSGSEVLQPRILPKNMICMRFVSGLNRIIPRHLSESRVVYGQAGNGPLMAVMGTEAVRKSHGR